MPCLAGLNDNTVAYWKFDSNASDSTSNNLEGTVSGATLSTGIINNSYYLNIKIYSRNIYYLCHH